MKQTSYIAVDSPFLETLVTQNRWLKMIHPYLSPFSYKTRAGGSVFSSFLLIYEQTAFGNRLFKLTRKRRKNVKREVRAEKTSS